MAKVDITTAEHTIIVEADEPLDSVAAKALDLWRQTRDPKLDRVHAAIGFQAERPEGLPTYVSGFDADLGHAHGGR